MHKFMLITSALVFFLVCSSLEDSPVGGALEVKMLGAECRDKKKQCPKWKNKCVKKQLKKKMERECPKTCGFCPEPTTEAATTSHQTTSQSTSHQTTSDQTTSQSTSHQTTSDQTTSQSTSHQTTSDQTTSQSTSHQTTTQMTTIPPCADISSKCKESKCRKYSKKMKSNCQETCGLC